MTTLDSLGAISSLLILSILAFLLNTFCICIIKNANQFRKKPSSILLVSLLATHLFQSVIVYPLYAFKKLDIENELWMKIVGNSFRFSYLLSFYGVCFGVLNIGLDRFLATYLLKKYKQYVTFKNTLIVVVSTWTYILLLCLIPFLPVLQQPDVTKGNTIEPSSMNQTLKLVSLQKSDGSEFILKSFFENNEFLIEENQTMAHKVNLYFYVPQDAWTVFMLFVNAAIPLGLTILCYIYVGFRLRKFSRAYRSRIGSTVTISINVGKIKLKEFDKYKQVTLITILITLTYSILWSPSIFYYTILSVCQKQCFSEQWEDSLEEKYIVYIIKYLSFLNSLFSPIIYCFKHPTIERKIVKLKRGLAMYHRRASSAYNASTSTGRLSLHNIHLATFFVPKETECGTI